MLKKIQKIVIYLNEIGFKRYLIYCYDIIAFLTCKLTSTNFIKVWPRNSYVFKKVYPGKSDIDLTVIGCIGSKKEDFYFTKEKINLLKKIFPIIGEANFYLYDDLYRFTRIGNYFEYLRDPILAGKVKKNLIKKDLKYDAFVFVLRNLTSDINYLKINVDYSFNKWKYIFELINRILVLKLNTNITKIDEIFKNLTSILPQFDFDSVGMLKLILEDDISEEERNKLLKKYFINFWLGENFSKNNFEEELESIGSFDGELKEIVLSQIRWEVFGIYSQLVNIDDMRKVKDHLSNLQKILKILNKEKEYDQDFGYVLRSC